MARPKKSNLPATIEGPPLPNPQSWVERLMPDFLLRRVNEVRGNMPKFFNISEEELNRLLFAEYAAVAEINGEKPTHAGYMAKYGCEGLTNNLRLRLWQEVDKARVVGAKKIHLEDLYSGICTEQTFKNYLLKIEVVAWLFCPPVGYTDRLTDMLDVGLKSMREILSAPITDSSGNIIVKLGKLKLDIVEMALNRLKGSVVQRQEIKSENYTEHNLHVSKDVSILSSPNPSLQPPPRDILVDRIKELDEEIEKLGKMEFEELATISIEKASGLRDNRVVPEEADKFQDVTDEF